ncbi:hypothetical protein CEXT_713841 [Caerostris extrusa]|uniref:Uncharacterized protein n=1 Tax=Caerostris extrusa TaxID=172846 RepID=A0AAV4SB55_CAEEX|nr:hypothetical protein CEXT_713841 [Caerostris extrusa]
MKNLEKPKGGSAELKGKCVSYKTFPSNPYPYPSTHSVAINFFSNGEKGENLSLRFFSYYISNTRKMFEYNIGLLSKHVLALSTSHEGRG